MKKFFATFLAVALVAVACCVFASAEDTNLALNKSYDINGYDYDPTNVNYQDNETGKLTDGQIGEVAPWSEGFPFVGFSGAESATPQAEHNGLTSSIVLDLGAESDVSKFVVHVTGGGNGGISYPSSVTYYVSADNANWTKVGEGSKLTDPADGSSAFDASELTLDKAVKARYVKVEFVQSGRSVFCSELEVFGTAGTGTTDESKSETESKTESEAVSSAAPVESSAAATSSTASSTPSTSDAGVFAVVVLAVVAVIGAAVVVKKRA